MAAKFEFRLPDIGEGVVEGEVVRWLVKEGDTLREDQPMVEVMTDKATVEIPSPRAGKVAQRMFTEGQVCPVGKVLIVIDTEEGAGESAPPAAKAAGPQAGPGPVAGKVTPPKPNGVNAPDAGVLALPATRKLARESGVDIREVPATGPGGRVTSEDVRAHGGGAPAAAPAPGVADAPGDVRVPFRGVRKKIGERLALAKRTAPHATYVEEVDVTALVALRAKLNAELAAKKVKLSFLPFLIKATVAALKTFPQMNAVLDEAAGEIVQRRSYHIGIAAATDAGLVVPVVRDAGERSLVELAAEIDRLAGLTRTGKAAREELAGSTFTITSLGVFGGLMATAIINHPEVAILGVHRIIRRPAVVSDGKEGEKIEIRDLMNLSLSFDHRVVDGYDAARFVADIKATLESPGALAPTAP
jgi:pyruvate dehydrogenase E2 component (dihydrolipoamide acetyltransferase)